MPAVHFQGVRKRFGAVRVLDGVDFSIGRGSCFALVGANGAGKTTCIKLLLDFGSLDGGEIRIFGVDHRESRARARLVFLPERFSPPHHLTGLEFLRYNARLHGATFTPRAVDEALAALDFERDALMRPARDYSKGMAQKLGLAACLTSGKDLLILDEPMSGLDPKARLLLKRVLSSLKAAGRTLFLTTHVLSDVHALCDAMAILDRARVRFAGSPAECLERFAADDLEEAYLSCIEG